jgi:hypothetical protein
MYHARRGNKSAEAALQIFREIEGRGGWPMIIFDANGWAVCEDSSGGAAAHRTLRQLRAESRWHNLDWFFDRLGWIAVIAAVAAAASVGWAVCPYLKDNETKELSIRTLSAFWTVPAVYFFFEFHWARATKTGRKFREVKESQKVAQKVWAAIVVALAVLYLKQH